MSEKQLIMQAEDMMRTAGERKAYVADGAFSTKACYYVLLAIYLKLDRIESNMGVDETLIRC